MDLDSSAASEPAVFQKVTPYSNSFTPGYLLGSLCWTSEQRAHWSVIGSLTGVGDAFSGLLRKNVTQCPYVSQ